MGNIQQNKKKEDNIYQQILNLQEKQEQLLNNILDNNGQIKLLISQLDSQQLETPELLVVGNRIEQLYSNKYVVNHQMNDTNSNNSLDQDNILDYDMESNKNKIFQVQKDIKKPKKQRTKK